MKSDALRQPINLNPLNFEKSAAGFFQLALIYKILVEPEGLISINPVYDWEGILFPVGRNRGFREPCTGADRAQYRFLVQRHRSMPAIRLFLRRSF
jgi:hypothetical protein